MLFPKPHAVATAFAGLRDIKAAIDLLNACQAASGGNVVTFELMPKSIINNVMAHYPDVTSPLEDVLMFSALIEIAQLLRPMPGLLLTQMPLNKIIENVLADALETALSACTIAANGNQRAALWAIRELTPVRSKPAWPINPISQSRLNICRPSIALPMPPGPLRCVFSASAISVTVCTIILHSRRRHDFTALYPH